MEPGLILMVGLSSILLVSSVNWLSVYLAIELQTLSLFILAALKRDSIYSTEAGLKYFVLGLFLRVCFYLVVLYYMDLREKRVYRGSIRCWVGMLVKY